MTLTFTKKELSTLLNSLSMFIISYLFLKIMLILVKMVLAYAQGIETTMNNFTLWGISAANSGVWNFRSVLSFYSSELITILIFMVASFVTYKKHVGEKGFIKFFSFWIFVTSVLIFNGLLTSGIITKSNVFHFFDWLYLSYSDILIIGLAAIFITLALGLILNKYFLKFRASNRRKPISNIYGLLKAYLITNTIPIFAGIFILYLPFWKSFHKYDFIEIATYILFVLSGLLLTSKSYSKKIHFDNISQVNGYLVSAACISYCIFYIFSMN